MISYYVGCFFIGSGIVVLLPLFTLIAWPQEIFLFSSYVIPGATSIILGYFLIVLSRLKRKFSKDTGLAQHQDTSIVLTGWIIAISVNAMPFIFSGKYSVSQAFFEAVSGWTTTGLSVVDVDVAPHIVLMHRSIMLFFGGIGIVLSVLFFLNGRGVLRLYTAEGHSDMLAPSVGKSARYIVCIYTLYIVIGIVLYCICGMSFFDSINHSIAALSTGGFSTHSESIGFYNSFSIEAVTVVLMILGSTNFFYSSTFFNWKMEKCF